MRRWLSSWLLLFCVFSAPFAALFARSGVLSARAAENAGTYLNIAVVSNEPLYADKLLYTALNDVGIHLLVTSRASMQDCMALADRGELDGVITTASDVMAVIYPHLIQVGPVLDTTNFGVYAREGGKIGPIGLGDWEALRDHRVAALTGRTFVTDNLPPGTDATYKENADQLFNGLLNGEYDVVIYARREHESLYLPKGIVNAGALLSMNTHLALNQKYEYLASTVAGALEKVIGDGRAGLIYENKPIPGAHSRPTILHLYSSSPDMLREERFNERFKSRFDDDVDWYSVSLDARRYENDISRQAYLIGLLRRDLVSKDVAAVVVSGEDALMFLQRFYAGFFPGAPVLYYGVGEEFGIDFGEWTEQVTGITEGLSAFETVSAALAIFPDTQKLLVVNGNSAEGVKYRREIERQLAPLAREIDVEYAGHNISREALLQRIGDLPEDSAVLFGSYYLDSDGQYYTLNDTTRMMEEICEVPVFTLYSTDLEYGAIGGMCPDYAACGDLAADKLALILDGRDARNVPVENLRRLNKWVFDAPKLERWGIAEASLPDGAVILNEDAEDGLNTRFVMMLVGILALSVIVIVSLTRFALRYRRQNAELIMIQKNLHTAEEMLQKDRNLREVRDRLQKIINTAPVAFMLTVDGYIKDANDYLRKNVGARKGDLATTVYTDPAQRSVLVKSLENMVKIENQVIRVNMASGESHRFMSNVSSVEYDGKAAYILWGIDIEQNERQKDQLEIARQNMKTILDTMPLPIRIMDLETLQPTYANDLCMEMFSVTSREEGRQLTINRFVPEFQPDGTPSAAIFGPLLKKDETVSVEVVCQKASGELFDARIITCKIDYLGRKSSLGIVQDMSAEKEYQRMLLNAAEREKEANQLKSRFLVNMSHEIRTPMNAIIGLTEIELRRVLPGDVRDIYKKINTSSKNLLEIINDVLDLSKIEADKMDLFSEEFELEDVLNSALLVASPRLEGKSVEFLLNASLELPRYLTGDRVRLWQILKNLLDNAAKYTEQGKIVMSVFSDNRRSNQDTVCVTFVIEDTGIGINDEQMKKLFTPYTQIYSDAQKRYAGTGLGMVISKQLCEIMGGSLEIDSKPGVGTSVYIKIPFQRSQNPETGRDAVRSRILEGKDILIVDDDPLSLQIMEGLLTGSGVRCVSASGGQAALDEILKFRDQGKTFDAVMLDYLMPGRNGLETARQIQASLSKTPNLLMVTAYQKQLFKQEVETSGISGVIEKPYIPSQFIKKLCAVLSGTDSEESDAEEFMRYKDARVLLCEDYRLNQEVALGMFAQFGITPVVAENGQEGVGVLENSEEPFDLVFMDLHMPVMDGFVATRIIRADPKFKDLPIISLTADAMKEVVGECIAAGMNDHLSKPISFHDLNRVFLQWLPEDKRAGKGDARQSAAAPKGSVNEALARFGGNKELYERALLDFAGDLPDKWPPFGVVVQNLEELKLRVHKFKGAAGNLAVGDLFRYATQFERTITEGKPDQELYEAFTGACDDFKRGCASYASDNEQPLAEEGTQSELFMLLSELANALADFDPAVTTEIVRKLESKQWPCADPDELGKLYELSRGYEFDEALAVTELMRGELQ